MNYIYEIKTRQHRNLRRILSYASLVLFLVCLANTAAAQSVTVSLLPSSESVWQNTTAATVYEGEKVQFIVQLSRTLNNNESVTVPLIMADNFLSDLTTRRVSGTNVILGNASGLRPTLTFSTGGRTVTLELALANPSGAGRIDYDASITFGNITNAVANTKQNILHFRILLDEFEVCFSESSYTIREGDDTQMILQLLRGVGRDTTGIDRTIGLREDITVTFEYQPSAIEIPPRERKQFEPFANNVTIRAGQVNFPLKQPIFDDEIIELPSQFLFGPQLTITSNSTDALNPCSTTINILDNDPTVTITTDTNVIAGNPATFTVTRRASLASPLTVTLNVSESSGGTIGNYVASTNEGQGISVIIPANQTTFVHSVPTMLDNRADRTDSILTVEVVSMSGSVTNTSGYYAGKANVATLSIMPKSSAIFIRTKVFLEGALQ